MASVARYHIMKRSAGSEAIPSLQPNTHEYTYVASALDISISFLSTEPAKQAMLSVARTFDENLPVDKQIFRQASDEAVYERVNQFIALLQEEAPVIVLDSKLPEEFPNVTAYHPRGAWSGIFNMLDQCVVVNEKLVDDMVNARAGDGEFRRFQFQFANVFFHEIGAHILFTYLYNGDPATPHEAMPFNWVGQPQPGHDANKPAGESGRLLEVAAFGGTLEFFNTPKVSTAWIVDRRLMARMVTKEAMEAAVIDRRFNIPYSTDNAPKDVSSLVTNYGRQEVTRTLGDHERLFIERAKEQPIRFLISRTNLHQVPADPRILAQPV